MATTRQRTNQRTPNRLADQLRDLIATERLSAGMRLPSETALTAMLATSRGNVRRALIVLEISGEVEIRHGQGAYVARKAQGITVPLATTAGPSEILRARLLVEGSAAAEAALASNRDDLHHLESILATAHRCTNHAEVSKLDARFHAGVAAASKNVPLQNIVASLLQAMPLDLRPNVSEPARAQDLDDHLDILAALKERSPDKARRAMRRHLLRAEEEWLRASCRPAEQREFTAAAHHSPAMHPMLTC